MNKPPSFQPVVEELEDRLSCSAAQPAQTPTFFPLHGNLSAPLEVVGAFSSAESQFHPGGFSVATTDGLYARVGVAQQSTSGGGSVDRSREISGIDGSVFDPRSGDRIKLRDARMLSRGKG